jgi:hypothetical protein
LRWIVLQRGAVHAQDRTFGAGAGRPGRDGKSADEAKDLKIRIEKEPDNPNKLHLTANGTDIFEWFRLEYQKVKEKFGVGNMQETGKNKGVRM